MNTRKGIWALSLLLLASSLMAADPPKDAKSATSDGDKPLSVSFGPQDGGGFGLVVKGSSYYDLTPASWDSPPLDKPGAPTRTHTIVKTALVYLAPDINYTNLTGKNNQAAVSVRPAAQFGWNPTPKNFGEYPDPVLWPYGAPFASVYLDARRQYGQFTNTQTKVTSDVNNTLLGVGGSLAVPYFTRWFQRRMNRDAKDFDPFALPMIQVTYYKAIDHSTPAQPVPTGIKADQVDMALKTAVLLRTLTFNDKKILPRFDFAGDVSRPTTGTDRKWKSKLDIALSAKVGESAFKPVISYTSGQKLGLKYDKQLLVGLAMEWVTNKKP
jgi:hypothetical protein